MITNLVVGNLPTRELATIGFVCLSFLLLVLLIKKVAWGPINKILDEREKQIVTELDNAEQAKSEAETLKQNMKNDLVAVKAEGAEILSQAEAIAEKSQTEIIQKARTKANEYAQKVRHEIEKERKALVDSSRKEIAKLSVQIAHEIMKKELDNEAHQNLIDIYIKELDIHDNE